ncbi:hypothetical protein [Kitasatospora sp. NPDC086791]|uniref:hypothetical protein n=1 Tax=Kitasatospora sp. NPDC086791 TaxID=3155178 RepID=UPI003416E631
MTTGGHPTTRRASAQCDPTRAHLAGVDYGLLTSPALIVLQRPLVYPVRRGRVLVTLLPAAALAVAVVAMLTIEVGACPGTRTPNANPQRGSGTRIRNAIRTVPLS